MKLIIKKYGGLPCSLERFVINGINADTDDFGSGSDKGSREQECEPYGCANWIFVGKPPTEKVLIKYCIRLEEYNYVVSQLERTLSVGSCGMCI
jgi:hypothetical protein